MRELAGRGLPPIGLGRMNLRHAYGTPLDEAQDTVSGPRYPEATQREIDTGQLSGLPRRREAGA